MQPVKITGSNATRTKGNPSCFKFPFWILDALHARAQRETQNKECKMTSLFCKNRNRNEKTLRTLSGIVWDIPRKSKANISPRRTPSHERTDKAKDSKTETKPQQMNGTGREAAPSLCQFLFTGERSRTDSPATREGTGPGTMHTGRTESNHSPANKRSWGIVHPSEEKAVTIDYTAQEMVGMQMEHSNGVKMVPMENEQNRGKSLS